MKCLDGPDRSLVGKVYVLQTQLASANFVKFNSDIELVREVSGVDGLVGEERPSKASNQTEISQYVKQRFSERTSVHPA